MDAFDAMATRRSVREFLPDTPSDEAVKQLIEIAVRAPSAVNRQPWSFTVVRDKALRDKISDAAKAYMTAKRPLDLPVHLYEKLADPNFHMFYHAPVLVVIAAKAEAPWIAEDCALAGANLMLAAHASALGACWIGLCQPFLATPEGKRMIGLSDSEIPLAPIIVGHPRAFAPLTPRNQPEIRWIG